LVYQQYYSNRMQQAITAQLSSGQYDLLMVEFSQMGYYDIATDIPKYVDQHNVEYEIMQRTYETEKSPLRRLLAKSEWRKYRNHEIENCEKFTACLTTSKRDAEILQQRSAQLKCHVIPNGVDSEYFKPGNTHVDPNMILFTGTISYYPNTEGIMWFHQNIWPLIKTLKPEATFCIAGKAPPPEVQNLAASDDQIIVTGAVDDMRDYYGKAAVVVVPLRVGGGTRLKILEGMAMQKAIVSTSVGAEGIDHTEGKNILLRDTPEDFANAVVEVMENDDLRADLERYGRELVELKYDWQAVSNILCDVFESNVKAA
ncbi:MAG: glycosyltransferase, partial [Pseudomonadota bacterium]